MGKITAKPMEINILNIDKFVKDRDLQEVKSSSMFIRPNEPDPEGLGSFEIFGYPGTEERKKTFAYIDLIERFINPKVYNVLVSLKRDYGVLINGEKEFYVDEHLGDIIKLGKDEEPPEGQKKGTGIEFLYKNFDKLIFNPEGAKGMRKDRLTFMNNVKKSEIFITKFLVIPPYYRDVDMKGGNKNEINIFYTRMINLASTLKSTKEFMSGLSFDSYDTQRRMMATLMDIMNYFVDFVGGNRGFLRKNVVGKATDFGSRMVISTPDYNTETPEDAEVSYDRSALPLSAVINLFPHHIIYGIRQIINSFLSANDFILYYDKKSKRIERHEIDRISFNKMMSTDSLMKIIKLYYTSKEYRLDPVEIPIKGGGFAPVQFTFSKNVDDLSITTLETNTDGKITIPLNWSQLFYLAAHDNVSDKVVSITRYPVKEYHSIYFSMMNIISCKIKKGVNFMGNYYPEFPMASKDKHGGQIESLYVDTLRIFGPYLAALGGDFDGDQVTVQGLFTDDENEEVRKKIYSKTNIINATGGTSRSGNEIAAHTIFNLTRGR